MTAVAKHCLCGGSMSGRVSPPKAAARIAALFDEVHTGDGHGPATAAQAAAARRRQDREIKREWEREVAG